MTEGEAVQLAVHYEVVGAGPPVVFTHDGFLPNESWDAQFDVFAASHRVARWDRRGYGRSAPATEPFSSAEDLADIARVVSDLPVALVGCSFGGLVSTQCVLDNPTLVSALVLVGPVVSGLPLSEHFTTRGGRGVPAFDAPVDEQIAYWSGTDPWFVAPQNTVARERFRALLTANPQNISPPVEFERTLEKSVLPRLGEISVPTLIVVGEQDHPDVHAHSGAIEAAIPGAKRVVLPGSGHVPHLEVPDAFNQLVLEFLR
jgi:3-oxoadipate enol-lactonase